MPANRVVALGSFCVSLGALVSAFIGVFPTGWQNAALGLVAVLGHMPVVLKFLDGSQKSEALQARSLPQIVQGESGVAGEPFIGDDNPDSEQWLRTRQEMADLFPQKDPHA